MYFDLGASSTSVGFQSPRWKRRAHPVERPELRQQQHIMQKVDLVNSLFHGWKRNTSDLAKHGDYFSQISYPYDAQS